MSETVPASSSTTTASPSEVTTTKTVAPGYKTTEFWLALVVKIIGAATAVGLIADGTTAARIAGLATLVLAQYGYTYSRTVLKAAV